MAERDFVDQQGDGGRALATIVECLHMLQKLPDAVEHLRQEMPNELQVRENQSGQLVANVFFQGIIQRATVSAKDAAKAGYSGNLLSILFASVIEQAIWYYFFLITPFK